MKFVIQRVNSASVKVDGNVIGSIGKGYLILFGAGEGDTEDMLVPFADKICKMRIFADENGKTNLSINDVGGEMLIVSQFTYMQIAGKATDQALYTPVSRILPMSYTRNS